MPRLSFSSIGRVALGLGILLVALAWARLWWRREPRADPRKVAVAVFTNRTGDPALEPLGSMVPPWESAIRPWPCFGERSSVTRSSGRRWGTTFTATRCSRGSATIRSSSG